MESLKKIIRDVPDFPKKGIVFKDITPVLQNGKVFSEVINTFKDKYMDKGIDKIIAIESRGFIFGSALAYALNKGLIIVRKPGKLPYKVEKVTYELEYGTDSLEMHIDAIERGDRLLLIDDLLATGGTAKAVCDLARKFKGEILETAFVIELGFLPGREKLEKNGIPVFSLLKF